MTAVDRDALRTLYAQTDDPWNFRRSAYEKAKFAATAAALPRPRYASILEIGCGNGELARRLAPRADRYTGLDAVPRALEAARRAVPTGHFVQDYLPCDLPDGPHDGIVLSEILYFLDAEGIDALAAQIDTRWPEADLICVTYRGPSGNSLEGEAALALFLSALDPTRAFRTARMAPLYRIELGEAALRSPMAAE
jgi:SAM-dependent methyltransferase